MISKIDFIDEFKAYGRQDQFSREGLGELYDYFIEYEETCDDEIELDVIGICCEFAEDTIENVLKQYELADIDELNNETSVVWYDDENVLYRQF